MQAEKRIVYIDPERCTGCRSCEMACAIEHSESKNLFTAISEKPIPKPRIKVVVADFFNVPMRCQHCEDSPCIEACPTGAIFKSEEGFVIMNQEDCIGCLMCVMVCPFGHPYYSTEYKSIVKCDFCIDRVKEGKEPACVFACPTGALKYGNLSDILDEIRKKKAKLIISGLKVEGLVYTKQVEEKKEEKLNLPDLKRMYSQVSWY